MNFIKLHAGGGDHEPCYVCVEKITHVARHRFFARTQEGSAGPELTGTVIVFEGAGVDGGAWVHESVDEVMAALAIGDRTAVT